MQLIICRFKKSTEITSIFTFSFNFKKCSAEEEARKIAEGEAKKIEAEEARFRFEEEKRQREIEELANQKVQAELEIQLQPGQKFKAKVAGQVVELTVPPGAGPGAPIRFAMNVPQPKKQAAPRTQQQTMSSEAATERQTRIGGLLGEMSSSGSSSSGSGSSYTRRSSGSIY